MNSIKAVSHLNNQNIPPAKEPLGIQNTRSIGDKKLNMSQENGQNKGLEAQLSSALETYNRRWDSAQRDFQTKLKTLAPEFRGTFELQRKVQELNFSTQFATQIGEALNNTLRKLQAGQG